MLSKVDSALYATQTGVVPTPREQARARTVADITRIGREHLAVYGAAGLSLRAVARDLGVVSSAVYRYVPSRDELLTLLVVDAYAAMADAVARAESAQPPDDLLARWHALTGGVRDWASAHPSRYALVFGTPVPGYHAPADRTNDPGTRVVLQLLRLVADAEAAGCVPSASAGGLPDSLRADVERVRSQYGLRLSDQMLTAALLAWVAVFGAVNFEVFGQFGADTFADPAQMFTTLMGLLAGLLGLHNGGGLGPGNTGGRSRAAILTD